MNTAHQSETSSCRDRLAKYCLGNGLDIGAGGDAIVASAICVDRAPGDPMRANTGQSPTHLIIDAIGLSEVFHFGSLDYIYSSHTLEDFQDTESVLSGWVSLVRKGGHIVLFLPDEQVYRAHCSSTGQPYNLAHVHADMGLTFMRRIVHRMGGLQIIHGLFPVPNNPYSFDLVLRKTQ